jgi:hypothetical protein
MCSWLDFGQANKQWHLDTREEAAVDVVKKGPEVYGAWDLHLQTSGP